MDFKSKLFAWFIPKQSIAGIVRKNMQAFFGSSSGTYRSLFSITFNGEKNLGEIGPIKDYKMDYEALRLRSWQAYIESEIAQTVINKFTKWEIGAGLKLQSEPSDLILRSEGVNVNTHDFSEMVEARYAVFCNSRESSYSGMTSLNKLAYKARLNAIIGGDVLVILRYIDGYVKTQLIDGSHVCSPVYGNEWFPYVLENGNKIVNGIEISPIGEHVAFYVRKPGILFEVERIPAKGSASGLTMAFMVYGLEYRLDNYRGIPLLTAVLETLKKMERYKEAMVGNAEEIAKIAYQVVHQIFSTGENPLAKQMAKARDIDAASDEIPRDEQGRIMANTVAVSTNKQAFNMPIGSELKIVKGDGTMYFKDFYTVNIDLICSCLGIPPEVAMSKYDSNFSSARAAIKDWEHTLIVNRKDFSFQFYQHHYNFWLEVEILKNKIQAPGYLQARLDDNCMIVNAYRTARFPGANVPHIDPVKEVSAERLKLGPAGAALPLTTVESSTERLSEGDSDANIKQFAEEIKEGKKLGIIIPESVVEPATT